MPRDCPSPAPPEACLVRAVTRAFDADPTLEAVKLDRTTGALSVATLGRPAGTSAAALLVERLLESRQPDTGDPCALLSGAEDCLDCPHSAGLPTEGHYTIAHQGGTTTIARVTCPTAPQFWRWRAHPFPRWAPRDARWPEDEHGEDDWRPQLVAAVACGLAGLIGGLTGEGAVSHLAFAAAYLAGSWYPAQEVWERLRQRHIDIHFLMLAVAAGAAAIHQWMEGAVLLFLFSLSGALEQYAMGRTHREIRSLIRAAPRDANVLDPEGRERSVPVDHLGPGLRIRVKPGELFPVDAEIVQGTTAADESNLTGEAIPVEKKIGDTVLGGTLNLWGVVAADVLRPARQSALQRILGLIHDAQRLKAPSQRFTDRFGTHYTVAILGLTLVMFFVWWLGFSRSPFVAPPGGVSAFYLAMTLLVVASPCALVLSIPSAILAAIAHAARRGILFRGGAAVEKLADIDVVAMDKTGTLTTGDLRVEEVESHPPGNDAEILRLAYGVERHSTHPLARAITRHAKQHQLEAPEAHDLESRAGDGVRASIDGVETRIGRGAFVLEAAGNDPAARPPALTPTEAGVSEVWVAHGSLRGRILLRDDIRAAARAVVGQLKAAGLRTVVLTGDRRSTGEHLQRQLEIDEVRSELTPEAKVEAIAGFGRSGHRVAMIGDGVNDAPALAAAHVGVAMGARGSDAALEQADVVLMHDRLENFHEALRLSHRARRIIRQNLILSLGTLLVLALLALSARLPLTRGVLGHEGSTVLVVLNSLRLLTRGRDRPAVSPPATAGPTPGHA